MTIRDIGVLYISRSATQYKEDGPVYVRVDPIVTFTKNRLLKYKTLCGQYYSMLLNNESEFLYIEYSVEEDEYLRLESYDRRRFNASRIKNLAPIYER